jgi:adenylylsulfate kinase
MPNNTFLKVLIMGLPGSGKTTLASFISEELNRLGHKSYWLNADEIRAKFNDWDFSIEGRQRQATRMRSLSNMKGQYHDIVICDFVCPLEKTRSEFNADYVVYMNTIESSAYADTNKIFEIPSKYNYQVLTKDSILHGNAIIEDLVRILNNKV